MPTTEITSSNFQEVVLHSKIPVMVHFYGVWSAPSRFMDPIMDHLATAYESKALICRLNVEENPDIATNYRIKAVPTIAIYQDGSEKDRVIGVLSYSTCCGAMDTYCR